MDGDNDGVKGKGNENDKIGESPNPRPTVTFVTFRFDGGMMVPAMWDTGPVYCGWCKNHKSASMQALYKHLRASHENEIDDLRQEIRGKTGKGSEFELDHEKGEWVTLENPTLKYLADSQNLWSVREENDSGISSVNDAGVCGGGFDCEKCNRKRKCGSEVEVARSGGALFRGKLPMRRRLLKEGDGKYS